MSSNIDVPSLLERIRDNGGKTVEEDLWSLAEWLDASTGSDAEDICDCLRVHGGISMVSSFLEHESPRVHQAAAMLIGNVCCKAVDSRAELTLQMVEADRSLDKLLPLVMKSEEDTVFYVLGAMQNIICDQIRLDAALVDAIHRMALLERMEVRARHSGPARRLTVTFRFDSPAIVAPRSWIRRS